MNIRVSHLIVWSLSIIVLTLGCTKKNNEAIDEGETRKNSAQTEVTDIDKQKESDDSLSLFETLHSDKGILVISEMYAVGEKRFKTKNYIGTTEESVIEAKAIVTYIASNPAMRIRELRLGTGMGFDESAFPSRFCRVNISEIQGILTAIDSVAGLYVKWEHILGEEYKALYSTPSGFEIMLQKYAKQKILCFGCEGARASENCHVNSLDELKDIRALFEEGLVRLREM